MIMVSSAKDKIGRKRKVINPMCMCCECSNESTSGGIPDFHSLVLRGGEDLACAAPSDAGDGAFVAGEYELNSFGDGVPNADSGVFGGGSEAWTGGRLKMVGFPC